MNSTCLKLSQYNMDSEVRYLLYRPCTFSTLFYRSSILHFKAVVMQTVRSNVPLKAATIFFIVSSTFKLATSIIFLPHVFILNIVCHCFYLVF